MKFREFGPQASRILSMRKMADSGYGWEDICTQWGINDAMERLRIRRMVLDRRKKEGDRDKTNQIAADHGLARAGQDGA